MRPPRRLRRAVLSASLIGLMMALGFPAVAPLDAQGPAVRQVLFLNSYHHGYEWSDALVQGMRDHLEAQPYPIDLRVESMDTRRFGGPEFDSHLEGLLRFKYAGRQLDAIVAADDAALTFLLERHGDLFAGVPVVYMGINNEALIARADPKVYTGLRENLRPGGMVELALALRPQTTRIIAIGDATPTAATQLEGYRAAARRYPDLSFEFLDGARLSLQQILDRLTTSGPTDVVLTTAFTRDVTGNYYAHGAALAQIAAASRGPSFSAAVSELGQGLLAGSENAGIRHATRAARMVVGVLEGRSPESIPREDDASPPFVIDHAQAVRWGIALDRLPADAVVVNRVVSFYEANRTLIWGAAGFMVLELAVIGALIVNIARRRTAERELIAQAARLEASNVDLERLNQSLRREADERRHAEDQLRQAQKIDAVGRLAGGIAHDFNNLLTVIGSYTDLLLDSLDHAAPERPHAEQIRRASERATALTHQLLAFSRKQVLQPRVVDLNTIVRSVEPMLRRLIGENVTLETHLSAAPVQVLVDQGQIEQVIVNLAVNARDAMPEGGRLVIETRATMLDEVKIDGRPGMVPGDYAQLVVTDTGHGMDAATQARIFEPFFTTKGPGEGTGLGLAMTYGIVKQSGGWIWVYSELGRGTAFKIYLPLSAATAPAAPGPSRQAADRARAGETVLLVEDQDDVRDLASRVLQRFGYSVLPARSGEEALRLADEHPRRISLLLTDVVMPGLSGREVAEHLTARRPDLRVLYMSGYTDNIIAQHGVLAPGTAFISKPFTPNSLATAVRAAIDR
jgi:signal transduction histidine kinase/ActR/RegA family two-component response regulator